MALKKSGLGKGLDAIFMENDTEANRSATKLRISEIEPNKNQPRSNFSEESLSELAESIAQHGVLQPLLVRPIGTDGYQVVAGERRWRACRKAGVKEVPVIIRDLTDVEVMQIALIENLQREDLSPIEEAKGYKSLIDTYNFTQNEVSKSVGKSRSAITNSLRLLSLPESVIEMISNGQISAGHARALISIEDEEKILKLARVIIEKDLSVREVEAMIKHIKQGAQKAKKTVPSKRNTFFDEVELSLKERLGRTIRIYSKKEDKGVLEIEFYSQEDLAGLARSLDCAISK